MVNDKTVQKMQRAISRAEDILSKEIINEEGVQYAAPKPLPLPPTWPAEMMVALKSGTVETSNEDDEAKPYGNGQWGSKTEKCIKDTMKDNPKMSKSNAIAICRARNKDK